MISSIVAENFKKFIPEECIKLDEPMSAHTTFKVGGPCDCMLEIASTDEITGVIDYLKKLEIPYFIMGNGSNLLVSDKGYRGVVIHLYNKFNDIEVQGDTIVAKSGALLSQVAKKAYEAGLTGLEFASGIPGTVGGAVTMNAGAYDGEMKQVVSAVKAITPDGEEIKINNENMEFAYRYSLVRIKSHIVTEVIFKLEKGDQAAIKAKMDDFSLRRKEKQPLEFPSAGSTFKRPEGYFAGKLIEDAGLKGFKHGGAAVSGKHSGFIINENKATAKEIYDLIQIVKDKVQEKFGVDLEPEVIMLGDFSD